MATSTQLAISKHCRSRHNLKTSARIIKFCTSKTDESCLTSAFPLGVREDERVQVRVELVLLVLLGDWLRQPRGVVVDAEEVVRSWKDKQRDGER